MNDFQSKVTNLLNSYSPVWLTGGAIRDNLLGVESRDLDIVCFLEAEQAGNILRENGYDPLSLGMHFQTLSIIKDEQRIDLVCIDDLQADALRRDFTINAIYMNPSSGEMYDPLNGREDLKNKVLRACGEAGKTFEEDPVRILRMVKFAVKFGLETEENTWNEAQKRIDLISQSSIERVTAELAGILVLPDAEKAVRMLSQAGYFDVFIPELSRLKGLEQNRYHSLDVWEHTLAVLRSTPEDLFLRLAGLFHDIGKWETAGRECYVVGILEVTGYDFRIGDYEIVGTRGKGELESRLKSSAGKRLSILGARLDHYPRTVQFKKIITGEQYPEGLTWVEKGKRHFLNHEKAGSKLLEEILARYSFSMFFDGMGRKREKDLLDLIENHMQATLMFMPELNDRPSRRSFRERAAELAWDICWDGRNYELQKIHDFVVLWKADFHAGKVHDEVQKKVFERIFRELVRTALWQKENLPKIEWESFNSFVSAEGLKGEKLGRFKDFTRARAIKQRQTALDTFFMKKAFFEFNNSKK